jgi:hypothetical protein
MFGRDVNYEAAIYIIHQREYLSSKLRVSLKQEVKKKERKFNFKK